MFDKHSQIIYNTVVNVSSKNKRGGVIRCSEHFSQITGIEKKHMVSERE